MSDTAVVDDGKIVCQIDNARTHMIQQHLRDHHPDWTVERYKAEFPHAPLMSEKAKKIIADKRAAKRAASPEALSTTLPLKGVSKSKFTDVFNIQGVEVKNGRGDHLMIDIFGDLDDATAALVPDVDENYVFNIELTKTVLMAFALNMPAYFWGYHGTGKTTLLEQVCARTNRAFMRAQHTIGTEESHIVGQYVVKDGATEFQPGPLTIAMIEGFVYCADEYDFAMPSVLSVYQPVLEGKALLIKDAPPDFRIVRPHKNFRFVATGNTNGGGDETGLYQGTQMQNAANYSRFGITEEVPYMDSKIEVAVVMCQSGIDKAAAEKIVNFAKDVREAFAGGRIGTTVSPRELINAAKIGRVRSGQWRVGMEKALINRMSRVDREVVNQFAQRVFG
jgi:cobaltochelatase CobS